jgi:hypothetical protein
VHQDDVAALYRVAPLEAHDALVDGLLPEDGGGQAAT